MTEEKTNYIIFQNGQIMSGKRKNTNSSAQYRTRWNGVFIKRNACQAEGIMK